MFTKRTSTHVDGGLDNKGFPTSGTKPFGDDARTVGVLESFCVTDGFIVLLTGVFVVAINERRTNTETRS